MSPCAYARPLYVFAAERSLIHSLAHSVDSRSGALLLLERGADCGYGTEGGRVEGEGFGSEAAAARDRLASLTLREREVLVGVSPNQLTALGSWPGAAEAMPAPDSGAASPRKFSLESPDAP